MTTQSQNLGQRNRIKCSCRPPPPNLHVEALTPMWYLVVGPLGDDQGQRRYEDGAPMMGLVPGKKRHQGAYSCPISPTPGTHWLTKRPCEHQQARKKALAKTSTALLSWTSSLRSGENQIFDVYVTPSVAFCHDGLRGLMPEYTVLMVLHCL